MKMITSVQLVVLTLLGSEPTWAGTELANNPPKAYSFSYQTAGSGKIVEKSVCKEHSGLDWKGCRRYAQWHFAVKCWDLGYDIKHSSGTRRQEIMKQKDFFCDAKRRVTALK